MTNEVFLAALACIGTGCWVVCFFWMHRISERQSTMLDQLKEQASRIETLSKREHDLIQEVHPKVEQIHQGIKEVANAMREESSSPPPVSVD
ncbi:MAG: hypothetical protein ABI042_05085 [Verrucomicrobiota bacterium]